MPSRTVTVLLAGDPRKLNRAFGEAETRAQKFTRTLKIGAAAGAAALTAVGISALKRAEELERLSRVAQVNVESFQRLQFQVERTGGTSDDLADSLREMQLRLQEAASLSSGPAVDAMRLLGISFSDLEGLDAPRQFALIRDRIAEIEDPTRRLFIAEELLGGSAERLTGILTAQGPEWDKVVRRSQEMSVASEQNIQTINDFKRDVQELINQALVHLINLGGEVVQVIQGIIATIKGLVDIVTEGKNPLDAFRDAWEETRNAARNSAQPIEETGDSIQYMTDKLNTSITALQGYDQFLLEQNGTLKLHDDAVSAANAVAVLTAEVVALSAAAQSDALANIGDFEGAAAVQRRAIEQIRSRFGASAVRSTIASNLVGFALDRYNVGGGGGGGGRSGGGGGRVGGGRSSTPTDPTDPGDMGWRNVQRQLANLRVRQANERLDEAQGNVAALEARRVGRNQVIGRGRAAGFSQQELDQLAQAYGRDQALTALEKSAYFAETGFPSEVANLIDQFNQLRVEQADQAARAEELQALHLQADRDIRERQWQERLGVARQQETLQQLSLRADLDQLETQKKMVALQEEALKRDQRNFAGLIEQGVGADDAARVLFGDSGGYRHQHFLNRWRQGASQEEIDRVLGLTGGTVQDLSRQNLYDAGYVWGGRQGYVRSGGGNTYNVNVQALDPQSAADGVYDAIQELEERGSTQMKVTAG